MSRSIVVLLVGAILIPADILLSFSLFAVLTAVGVYGDQFRANPLLILGSAITYNLVLVGALAAGGAIVVSARAVAAAFLSGAPLMVVTLLAGCAGAIPALVYNATAHPDLFSMSNTSTQLPVVYALLLALMLIAVDRPRERVP